MKAAFSPALFSLAYCAGYVAAFALNLPMFLYYPLGGEFTWGRMLMPDAGPAMAWYGLMASAAALALPVAVLVPQDWLLRRLRSGLWLLPCAAILACAVLLRGFFV